MIPELRHDFNARWTSAGYERLLSTIERELGERPEFRVAETPCFFPPEIMAHMAEVAQTLTRMLVDSPAYLAASDAAIPARYRIPEPAGPRPPNFMTVDFGFVREPDGTLGIRLVELQAFPSVFGFQDLLSRATIEAYHLDPTLHWLQGDTSSAAYWSRLNDVIVAGHDPAEVVLLEVTPHQQKTRVDFRTYEQHLGIRTVDITTVRQRGRTLEYQPDGQRDGRWTPIRRIFNRAIADEIERLHIEPGFDYTSDLDVEWAGHPNWYFRASKFSLPFLEHPAVPRAVFLDDYLRDPTLLPFGLDDTLLKPLFSFAGKGIRFSPTPAELNAIPEADRHGFLLQQRVHFEPVIETPHGPTKAEIRIMLVASDAGTLTPVISMVRLGRGLMMGVDQNRDQLWVGGSAALFPAAVTTRVYKGNARS